VASLLGIETLLAEEVSSHDQRLAPLFDRTMTVERSKNE
jgi:hypothetical protein